MLLSMNPLNEKTGVHQQFAYLDYDGVREAISLMHELEVGYLRTDLPFSEQNLVGENRWNRWMLEELHDAGIKTTLSVLPLGAHTNSTNLLADYFSFTRRAIAEYGDLVEAVEAVDPLAYHHSPLSFDNYRVLGSMIANLDAEAKWAGTTVAINGIETSGEWIERLREHASIPYGVILAVHAPTDESVWSLEDVLARASLSSPGSPVWVTSSGYSSWDDEDGALGKARRQSHKLRQALSTSVDRVYWSSLMDLPYTYQAFAGEELSISDYHRGLVTETGDLKPAFEELKTLLKGEGMPSIPALA